MSVSGLFSLLLYFCLCQWSVTKLKHFYLYSLSIITRGCFKISGFLLKKWNLNQQMKHFNFQCNHFEKYIHPLTEVCFEVAFSCQLVTSLTQKLWQGLHLQNYMPWMLLNEKNVTDKYYNDNNREQYSGKCNAYDSARTSWDTGN